MVGSISGSCPFAKTAVTGAAVVIFGRQTLASGEQTELLWVKHKGP